MWGLMVHLVCERSAPSRNFADIIITIAVVHLVCVRAHVRIRDRINLNKHHAYAGVVLVTVAVLVKS